MVSLTPLPGHVYIEPILAPEARGLIALPDSVKKEETITGRIVALAAFKALPCDCCPDCCPNFVEGMDQSPMDSRVGDYAVFRPRKADVFSVKGRMFLSLHEDDLLLTTPDFDSLTKIRTNA